MIRVIIFDADGVLIETEVFSKQFSRDYSIPLHEITPFFTGIFDTAITGKADLKEIIKPYLKKWGWQKSPEAFLDYWFTSEHHLNKELLMYIQHLREKKITCVVATNQEKYRATYMLEKMGFSDSFTKLYASCHLGSKKPDQLFFQKVFDDLKDYKKEGVLFWDDSEENVKAAKEFGIQAELYTSFGDFQKIMKKYIS